MEYFPLLLSTPPIPSSQPVLPASCVAMYIRIPPSLTFFSYTEACHVYYSVQHIFLTFLFLFPPNCTGYHWTAVTHLTSAQLIGIYSFSVFCYYSAAINNLVYVSLCTHVGWVAEEKLQGQKGMFIIIFTNPSKLPSRSSCQFLAPPAVDEKTCFLISPAHCVSSLLT